MSDNLPPLPEHWVLSGLVGTNATFQRAAREYAEDYARAAIESDRVSRDVPDFSGGGLVAIKTLLSRDPCAHATTAIAMIDVMLASTKPQPVQASQYGSPELQSLILEKLAQPARAQPSGWKPIETAPKDGTAILALLDGSDIPHAIRWHALASDGEGWYMTWDHYKVTKHDGPVCWMEIPDDPKTAEQAQKEE